MMRRTVLSRHRPHFLLCVPIPFVFLFVAVAALVIDVPISQLLGISLAPLRVGRIINCCRRRAALLNALHGFGRHCLPLFLPLHELLVGDLLRLRQRPRFRDIGLRYEQHPAQLRCAAATA